MSLAKRDLSPHLFLAVATAILLLAAFLRLVGLDSVPPGLAQDEVFDAGMVSHILAGNHALFFREGYGHEPFYHYWMIPFQLLLGDNWLAARFSSVVLGLLVVALTMRWVKRDFGVNTAVFTATLLAVSWWPIIFSRLAIRPISEPVFLLLGVWFWPTRPWLGGLFWGLSFYTYTGARIVWLIPAAMLAYSLLPRLQKLITPRSSFTIHHSQFTIHNSLIVLIISLLVYIPLGLTLYLDPTLQQRIDQLSGPLDALWQRNIGPILETTLATLGVFAFTGDPRWTYTVPDVPLFAPFTAVLFFLGLGLAVSRWRDSRYALALIWLAVGLIPSAVTPQAPSIIRMIGALPVVYLFTAVGLNWLGGKLPAGRGRATLFIALVLLVMGLNLGRTLYWGFTIWPHTAETRRNYQTVLQEIGQDWQTRQPARTLVINHDYFIMLDDDTVRRNLGFAPDPAVRWAQSGAQFAGAVVVPHLAPSDPPPALYVPEYAPPAPELLAAGGYALEPVYRSERTPSFAVHEHTAVVPPPTNPYEATFDQRLTLLGYDLLPRQNNHLILLTHWRVEDNARLPVDLKAFLHLLTPEGEAITQHDGWDAAPLTLHAGDRVIQRHLLDLSHIPPDNYTLQLGLYRFYDGQRLPHTAPNQPPDRLLLTDVMVE